MDIPQADHDSKRVSYLNEATWTEKLLGVAEYKLLVGLWNKKLAAMEADLHSLSITAERRQCLAHEIHAFKGAMTMLQDHHTTHLKLFRAEEAKEAPDAKKPTPVL